MAITRLNRAKDHRIFRDFSWPATLYEFGRFNLIYGWNGSGKTTLSELFKCIEKRVSVTEGTVEFYSDGTPINGATLSTATTLPRARVFNRAYVDANIHLTSTSVNFGPIFYLGEKNVEKQKRIEELKVKRGEVLKKATAKAAAILKVESALDTFCQDEARKIKELLSSSPSNSYNNYNKTDFRLRAEALATPDAPSKSLTPEKRTELKQKKEEKPKESLVRIETELPDLKALNSEVVALLQRKVVSEVIDSLSKDSELADWVRTGLRLHTGNRNAHTCRFCENTIPTGRVDQLEAHFNDAYAKFLGEIDALIRRIEDLELATKELSFPSKAEFYDAFTTRFVAEKQNLEAYKIESAAYLGSAKAILQTKRTKPFEVLVFDNVVYPDRQLSADALSAINTLIESHNADTANFQKIVTDARKDLEDAYVAEALPSFKKKAGAIMTVKNEERVAKEEALALAAEIDALEKEVVEHRRPAEELNAELCSYLGRDELRFEFKDSGYEVTRNGHPALNLSEGERTAIAFLYFLKTLQDKGFTLSSDIVVIDDPVSSLDTNALFCAFGYLKERTKEAGQLFVLTHNFGLFRQVKNWFNFVNGREKDVTKHKARFFMIDADIVGGARNAKLTGLDPLLHEFESEYHYLFKKVYDCSLENPAATSLEKYYSMPNIARRLLESFLCFRYPHLAGHLAQQIEKVSYDAAKKARVLRFLHTYSHDGKIAEPEHDLSILSETPEIMKDVLGLAKAEDVKHFESMVVLVK